MKEETYPAGSVLSRARVMIRIHKLCFSAKSSCVERNMVKRRKLTSFYCFIALDVNFVGLIGKASPTHEGCSPLGEPQLCACSLMAPRVQAVRTEEPGPVHDRSMFPAGAVHANFAVIFLHRLLVGELCTSS